MRKGENDNIMAKEFDIFNAPISVVSEGLEGKVITLAGSNNLGKTLQATRMGKPLHLSWERSLGAIAGVPHFTIKKWSDFKKLNKQLTDDKTKEKAKEVYQTIIFDEVYASALLCQQFVCNKWGAQHMGERIEGAPNLYQEYEKEYFTEINKLINSGFTVIFISHVERDNETKQWRPKGDKRSIVPIIDNSDLVVFLASNGVDENGQVIKSTAYLAETEEFFARSKFRKMPTSIEEFTAENLETALAQAIREQAEEDGIATVSYDEYIENGSIEDLDFDQLKVDIQTAVINYSEKINDPEKVAATITKIVEKNLGKGRTLKDVEPEQVEQLAMVLSDIEDLLN